MEARNSGSARAVSVLFVTALMVSSFVISAYAGGRGFNGGVGGAVPPTPNQLGAAVATRTPTPSVPAGQLEFTPLPTASDSEGILSTLFDNTESRNKAILASILAILAILALLWLLRRKKDDTQPPVNPAA